MQIRKLVNVHPIHLEGGGGLSPSSCQLKSHTGGSTYLLLFSLSTNCILVFITSLIHSAFGGSLHAALKCPPAGRGTAGWGRNEPSSTTCTPSPSPRNPLQRPKLPTPTPHLPPKGSQFKSCSGISTSLRLGGMKTITSTSLETSLELELWSLFLPSGFNPVEKVRGEGGLVSPQLPEQQESNSL